MILLGWHYGVLRPVYVSEEWTGTLDPETRDRWEEQHDLSIMSVHDDSGRRLYSEAGIVSEGLATGRVRIVKI